MTIILFAVYPQLFLYNRDTVRVQVVYIYISQGAITTCSTRTICVKYQMERLQA